ncbi:SGNH/GDSL hydrolase family protein [Devosia sp. RR2S18]|uniref:SGNH/GDSL hydrolase family protein n=1 Tax=Devosia rhizosphaerae TaxID=3049774 RepID=UPI0025422665|nr:SGNH/GDSL hydrolase family protein [Devosia sp. RR2S18]WIJ27008.1 SGNH/GDSL hydrolase family protein [Devosia sp. RR2S18]
MKVVLAFGDSLTWGADAETGGRHSYEDRWPSVLEQQLAGEARVIAEGLSGRTTSFDDHASLADLNGVRALPMLLATHTPIDIVAIMLGTNDLKPHLCGTATGAAFGMRRLAEIVATYPFGPGVQRPKVLLIAPPIITEPAEAKILDCFAGAASESQRLAQLFQEVASAAALAFVDAGTVARSSPVDGVHLDADNTRAIGLALAPIVRGMLHGQ